MNARRNADKRKAPGTVVTQGNPRVGIVGHSRAGKSTFLAVLLDAFQHHKVNVIGEESSENRKYQHSLSNSVRNGYFPAKTPINNEDRSVKFGIQDDRLGVANGRIDVDFFDPAGDVFERSVSDNADAQVREAIRDQVLQRLMDCTGLIVMMDAEASSNLQQQIFSSTLEELMGRKKVNPLPLQVVVLFTKADSMKWIQRFRIKNAKEWAKRQYPHLVETANLYCHERNVHYAFSSAAGWLRGRPNVSSVVIPRHLPGRTDEMPARLSQNRTNLSDDERIRLDRERSLLFQLPKVRGEHIPDPALSPEDIFKASKEDQNAEGRLRFMSDFPMFSDPYRLISPKKLSKQYDEVEGKSGVLNMYGAAAHASDGSKSESARGNASVAAWNVIEPVLIAAGVSERGLKNLFPQR
jgi:GTP-binding protein EngB required for normal cell division